MDDVTVHFVLEAVDMVATHGWKLLPQVNINNYFLLLLFLVELISISEYSLNYKQMFVSVCRKYISFLIYTLFLAETAGKPYPLAHIRKYPSSGILNTIREMND